MPADLRVRPARGSDCGVVMDLLAEATRWLADRGSDQWQQMEQRRLLGVLRDIGEGTLFLVLDNGKPIATCTVDELADAEFWQRSDRVRTALYVHRMAVARSRSGESIGSAMLDWAGRRALLSRRTLLRLDAWRDNHDLHKYYRKQGFRQVRVVPLDEERPRGSGALFERPARIQQMDGPLIVPNWPAGDRSPRDPAAAPIASPHG